VAVFDGSGPLAADDRSLANLLHGRTVIPVINKSDLPQRLCVEDVTRLADAPAIAVSAQTGEGLDALRRRLASDFFGPLPPSGAPVVFTARQRDLLCDARGSLQDRPSTCAAYLGLMVQ